MSQPLSQPPAPDVSRPDDEASPAVAARSRGRAAGAARPWARAAERLEAGVSALRPTLARLDAVDRGLALAGAAALVLVPVLDVPLEILAAFGSAGAFGAVTLRLAGRLATGDAAAAERIEALEDRVWRFAAAAEDWRDLLGASGEIVLAVDADRAIVFANPRFEATFGLGAAQVIGEPLDRVLAGFAGAAESAPDDDHDALTLVTIEGPRRFVPVETGIPDAAADGPVASVVLSDVTERIEVETMLRRARDDAQAASEAKSRFLALASHEIRTPLAGIIGMADLIAATPLSPAQADHVRAVRASGTALLALVDDVLDLAKIDAGRLDFAPAPVRVERLIEEVVELLAPRAQAKGIELGGRVGLDVPAEIEVDEPKLRQVLVNLAGNAVKFTERGGVAIEVDREPMTEPTAPEAETRPVRLRFTVRDTGIGIAPADAERIFREFEQVEQGPTRRFGGTGLGLAIAREIVRRMGGDISLASRAGAGSTFHFTLDLPAAGPAEPAAPTAATLGGRRVAIVAAGAIEAPLLATRLGEVGAAVTLVRSAEDDAVDADVVLIEQSAAADAGAALQRLRAAAATAGREAPPAAVLVTPAERGELDRLKELGFAAHLVKPVRRRSLERVVGALVRGEPVGADPAELDTAAADTGEDAAARGPSRPLAVLLADDDPVNAILARAMLARLGHTVETVTDGAAAVAAVARRRAEGAPFDVLLTDLHMPGMGGAEAIRAIRATEAPEGPRLLVVVQTADVTAASRRAAEAAGADATLVKPLESAALATLIDARTRTAQPRA